MCCSGPADDGFDWLFLIEIGFYLALLAVCGTFLVVGLAGQ